MKANNRKIAWVTGASQGIGRETAFALVRDGYHVVVTARSEQALTQMVEQVGHENMTSYTCDILDGDKVSTTIEWIETSLGAIDLAILNAGTYVPETISDGLSVDHFRSNADLNLYGTVNCLYPLLNRMKARGKGHIAIVASVAGYRGLPRSLGYGASKAALINLTEALYIEARGTGVKIQLINPGFVKTPLTDKNEFPMPFIITADQAAAKIITGLKTSRFEICFPWIFAALLKLVGILPNRLYLWLTAKGTKK